MKKQLLLPILATMAILPSCGFAPHASAIEENETYGRLYTFEEMPELYRQYEEIRDADCTDSRCRMNFFYKYINEHPEFAMLRRYLGSRFTITAINPENNTFRAYFHDFDLSGYERNGREKYDRIAELYIGWGEPGVVPSAVTSSIRSGGTVAGVHSVVNATANVSGGVWFPPNREVEISAPGADFISDSLHTLYYTAWFESGNFNNFAEYSSCFEAGYAPGQNLECRLRIKEDGSFIYLPYSLDEPEPEPTPEPTSDPSEDSADEPENPGKTTASDADSTTSESAAETKTIVETQEITNYVPMIVAAETSGSSKDEKSANGPASQNAESDMNEANPAPLAAEKYTPPYAGCEKEYVFPWWFILLVLAADAVIMWIFWPKNQKSQK